MRSIAKLFGRSPFHPLQAHMEHVADAVEDARASIDAYLAGQTETVEGFSTRIGKHEAAADQMKEDMIQQLRRGIFMSVDRSRLKQIILVQDSIADKAQNLGVLLTLKPMGDPPGFIDAFRAYADKNVEAFQQARKVIGELDELVEASFGGSGAQHVVEMTERVSELETESDELQLDLLRSLFAAEDTLSTPSFYLWTRVFKQVSQLSDLSERLANRVRGTLQTR